MYLVGDIVASKSNDKIKGLVMEVNDDRLLVKWAVRDDDGGMQRWQAEMYRKDVRPVDTLVKVTREEEEITNPNLAFRVMKYNTRDDS